VLAGASLPLRSLVVVRAGVLPRQRAVLTIDSSRFLSGDDLINNIITFASVAEPILFFVVKPVNLLAERRARAAVEPASETRPCTVFLSEIPKVARRRALCTAQQVAVTA